MDSDYDSYSERETLSKKLSKTRSVRHLSWLEELLVRFSPGERLALYVCAALLSISAFVLLAHVNSAVSVLVPASGGELIEGEVGPVRFVNPVITLSQADDDLSDLVYSGLTRALPDGSIASDIASSYKISEDGTTYTFALRPDATFHDGTPLTSADVMFTVQTAQNAAIKSPRRADWEGVVVSAPDSHTVVFKLPHAYAPFIENTTMGILPKHLWATVSPEEFPFSPLNTHPVGSGAYRVSNVTTDSTGSITRYELTPFSKFTLGKPYLGKITMRFYANDDAVLKALNAHEVDAVAGIAPASIASITRGDVTVMHSPLPRVFGVFYNQSHSTVLADASVRAALEAAVNQKSIVHSVLDDYGAPLDGPIPPGFTSTNDGTSTPVTTETATSTLSDKAHAILQHGGWSLSTSTNVWTKKNGKSGSLTLSFTLATADEPELVATANQVASEWKAAGINVDVHVYSLSDLNSTILRPRQYDAILFGEVVGRALDLFAFWHSSQRNDPGLNLSLYTNSKADSLLSQARADSDAKDRAKLYDSFAKIIETDRPALFLYSPEFIYVVPSSLHGIALGALTTPGERFLNVYQWYTDTEEVWSIFSNNQ